MGLSRRLFIKKSFFTVLLLSSMEFVTGFVGGCYNIFTTISNYVTVGLDAFQSVLNLLAGFGIAIPIPGASTVLAMAIASVKAGFADVETAITDYENAPAANKTTLLGRISVVISDLQGELSAFWTNLNLPNAQAASLIKGLIGIIVSTLAGFATQLPALASPTPAAQRSFERGANALIVFSVAPQRRTIKQFKSDFNNLLIQNGHPEAVIR